MSRYIALPEEEAATQPGSRGRVLRNKRSIKRKREIDRAENEALLVAQAAFLRKVSDEMQFTVNVVCEMHRNWLGDLYEWAGRYRRVEVSKEGFTWPPALRVAENMADFERDYLARHTPCPPDGIEQTARRMAEVHAELLFIHPFREGNGRCARWLADLMALQAGLPLPTYHFEGRGSRAEKARYLRAVIQGYQGKYDLLTRFFAEAIERGQQGGTR